MQKSLGCWLSIGCMGVRQAGYKYDGEYNEKNQRHGQGHAEFHNGDLYDGQYESGKRHGRGVYKSVTSPLVNLLDTQQPEPR